MILSNNPKFEVNIKKMIGVKTKKHEENMDPHRRGCQGKNINFFAIVKTMDDNYFKLGCFFWDTVFQI